MMLFNYDPILGLTYCFFEPSLILDLSAFPDSLNMTPEEVISLFRKRGLVLGNSLREEPTEVFSLFHNGVKCEEDINWRILDEAGQFDFGINNWYDYREVPSHDATDKIIECLNN
jgi:hypothetical protein